MLFILIILLVPRSQWVPSLLIKHFFHSRLAPLKAWDVFIVGRFWSWDVLQLGPFGSWYVLGLGTFWVLVRFRAWDVLGLGAF